MKASTSSSKPNSITEINELDVALEELSMLSTTNRRITSTAKTRNYMNHKNLLNLIEMDSRYVSSVSIGLRMKSIHPHGQFRMKPYVIPRPREERHRTRSENSDVLETNTSLVASVIDAVVSVATDEVQNIKKSKSLENVHLEDKSETQYQPEVELVSTCIQKLKMAEW